MSRLHNRLERLRARVRETITSEVPGVPIKSLHPAVCMPYPEDDKDLVFFYGEGVVPHTDFDYATTRLSELLQEDGIETAYARVTRTTCAHHFTTARMVDLPENRFVFLAQVCGCDDPPDTIVSWPLLAPAVVTLTVPGSNVRTKFLVV